MDDPEGHRAEHLRGILSGLKEQNRRSWTVSGCSLRCQISFCPQVLVTEPISYDNKDLARGKVKAFTLKVHFLSFCKHLLTAGTAGTRGVVVLLPSLGGTTEERQEHGQETKSEKRSLHQKALIFDPART